MGAIYKRGRVWYLDIRVKGKRIRRRIGASKKVAVLALKDAEVKTARNEFGFTHLDIEIEAFFKKFLEYSRVNHSENTTKRYRAVIDNFTAFLRGYPDIVTLSQVRSELIEQYKVYRKDGWVNPNGVPVKGGNGHTEHTRKGARAKTINFELNTLRTIFYRAVHWDYLRDNPVKNVSRLKTTDSKPIRFLTPEECERLLDHSPDHLRPIFTTLLLTGMRKGELENLEWADVDFRRKRIRIRQKPFWQPKTGEREIPIGQKLLPLLQDLRAENDAGLRSDFVFPHKDGGRIKTKLREKLIEVGKAAGIKDLTTLHALRHTFASQLVMSGVDLPTVQRLMGHTDIQTTMIYAHLAPDHLASAVDRLDIGL